MLELDSALIVSKLQYLRNILVQHKDIFTQCHKFSCMCTAAAMEFRLVFACMAAATYLSVPMSCTMNATMSCLQLKHLRTVMMLVCVKDLVL